MPRQLVTLRLGAYHRIPPFVEQQRPLANRIGERLMRRQQQDPHDRRSGTQQLNLFTTENGSSVILTPEWLMLPEPTRKALTTTLPAHIYP